MRKWKSAPENFHFKEKRRQIIIKLSLKNATMLCIICLDTVASLEISERGGGGGGKQFSERGGKLRKTPHMSKRRQRNICSLCSHNQSRHSSVATCRALLCYALRVASRPNTSYSARLWSQVHLNIYARAQFDQIRVLNWYITRYILPLNGGAVALPAPPPLKTPLPRHQKYFWTFLALISWTRFHPSIDARNLEYFEN